MKDFESHDQWVGNGTNGLNPPKFAAARSLFGHPGWRVLSEVLRLQLKSQIENKKLRPFRKNKKKIFKEFSQKYNETAIKNEVLV